MTVRVEIAERAFLVKRISPFVSRKEVSESVDLSI